MGGDVRWAMDEASEFLQGKGTVHQTLRRIAARLRELGIPYAVVGGLSLFAHGFRRFTEDVDVLVTAEGLRRIHDELAGRGYRPPFAGSKNLRDAESGVKVEFLVTGQFPGDGRPKPVAFPDPAAVATEIDGVQYLNLPTLIELKLASGMTSPERLRDLSDVMELIRLLDLPIHFAQRFDPSVREKYAEIWRAAHPPEKRYLRLWADAFPDSPAQTPDEMAQALRTGSGLLAELRADGVRVEVLGPDDSRRAYLVTTDPAVARKYDMHDESEFR